MEIRPTKEKSLSIKCNWCGKGDHIQDNCYWLVGQPGQPDNSMKNSSDEVGKKQYHSKINSTME